MIMRAKTTSILVALLTFCIALGICKAQGGLKMNFYQGSCTQAEEIIKYNINKVVPSNTELAAKLLRMHFHDCFVNGCDASVLLDRVPGGPPAEKEAIPNLTLTGFDLIDDIKEEIEKKCPNTVSCADILAVAARDAVAIVSPNRPFWAVPTGRRDGNRSLASDITGNIPSPFSNFDTMLEIFKNKGLDLDDLVLLSGGHSIGIARCGTFSNRLYNFTGKGDQDPSLDPTYATTLKEKCPNPANPATTVPLDPPSPMTFDESYYKILLEKKGLLTSDAALLTNGESAKVVRRLADSNSFMAQFANSMKKMGAIGVLTGNAGQIRKNCRVVN